MVNVPGYGPVALPLAVNVTFVGMGARHRRWRVNWTSVAEKTSPLSGPAVIAPDCNDESGRDAVSGPSGIAADRDAAGPGAQPGSKRAAQPAISKGTLDFMMSSPV